MSSKENLRLVSDPMFSNNPITKQVLGICSALAITVQLEPAIVMSLSMVFVLALSSVTISLLRKLIPNRIRIVVQLLVIASLVILVDQVLKAFAYSISKQLSVFVGLIITNCIVMGRLEAFSLGNTPWRSFLDALGNGFGYGIILILVSIIRELFGAGTLYGYQIVPQALYDLGYENNGLFLLPPMAMIIMGLFIGFQNRKKR